MKGPDDQKTDYCDDEPTDKESTSDKTDTKSTDYTDDSTSDEE